PMSQQVQHSPMSQQVQHSPMSQQLQQSPMSQQVQHSPMSQQVQHSPISQQVQQSPISQQLQQSPHTPLQQPHTPLQQPNTPLQQPHTPLQQPLTPLQQPLTPLQQPLTPQQPATRQLQPGPNKDCMSSNMVNVMPSSCSMEGVNMNPVSNSSMHAMQSPAHPMQSPASHCNNLASPDMGSVHSMGTNPDMSVVQCNMASPEVTGVRHNPCNNLPSPHSNACNSMPSPAEMGVVQGNTMGHPNMGPTMQPGTLPPNTGYGEIDVNQLPGLESPTSISSTEMQNSTGSSVENTPTQNFTDCAQLQGYCVNNQQGGSYMDVAHHQNASQNNMVPVVSAAGTFTGMLLSPTPPQVQQPPIQQQQQQQQHQGQHGTMVHGGNFTMPQVPTQRLSHANIPYTSGHNAVRQQYPANPTSCSLAKLQQLTNGINMDLLPENTMTPPPNLTPPPVNMTPPPIQRNMTPPIPNLQPQMNNSPGAYKQHSRRSSVAMIQKSPNVTVNPNMSFSPNVTLQPGTNVITGYNLGPTLNGYRLQQPALMNTGAYGYIQQPQIGHMQMMNTYPQAANFQQQMQMQMQPPQNMNNSMYYGYINRFPAQTINMNGVNSMSRR
ncbi:unnamed protein product, partial [Owenia fusiformis]